MLLSNGTDVIEMHAQGPISQRVYELLIHALWIGMLLSI